MNSDFSAKLRARIGDGLLSAFMPLLPKKDMSHLVGRLVHKKLPKPLARASVDLFARAYKINLAEAELPIENYPTIGALFARKLKPGVRPIGAWPVHPADGVLTECGPIKKLQLIQAKEKFYSVAELLRSSRQASGFEGGAFFTYYLCPTDYHRVHSPVDGNLTWSCHIPGEFWPVNNWSVGSIAHLFTVNERVAMIIETPRGRVAVVMVAATNVGNMQMAFDENISTNARGGHERAAREKLYDPPKPMRAGEELGTFRMGSTVVVLFENGVVPTEAFGLKGHAVKMGEPLSLN